MVSDAVIHITDVIILYIYTLYMYYWQLCRDLMAFKTESDSVINKDHNGDHLIIDPFQYFLLQKQFTVYRDTLDHHLRKYHSGMRSLVDR